MIRARVARFLVRHPLGAVIVLLAVLAVLAAVAYAGTIAGPVAESFGGSESSTPSAPAPVGGALVAPDRLPAPKESLNDDEVEAPHQALHDLTRACKRPMTQGPPGTPQSVSAPLRIIEDFASRHPNAGFVVDDGSATTLTLLIVVRNELEACIPALIPRIDALIPAQYRPR